MESDNFLKFRIQKGWNMRYYKYLYLTEGLRKKKKKMIKKLNENRLQLNIHVITLAQNERDQLEIYNSMLFLQPDFPNEDFFVVGIAKDI